MAGGLAFPFVFSAFVPWVSFGALLLVGLVYVLAVLASPSGPPVAY